MAVMLASFLTVPGEGFRTIGRGSLSGLDARREAVARTAADWRALWTEHAAEQPLPEVDFTTSMVVAVFLGSKMTAGYEVTITAVDPHAGGAVVRYRETRPGPDRMVAQVITSPFHIVAAPRVEGEVTFIADDERGR